MKELAKIARILTNYAKSDGSGSIAKVHFFLEHDPSDVPGMEQWTLLVKLVYFDDFDKQDSSGKVVPSREKETFEVTAESPDLCVEAALKAIGEFLQQEMYKARHRMEAVTDAISAHTGKTEEEMAREVPPSEEDVPEVPN